MMLGIDDRNPAMIGYNVSTHQLLVQDVFHRSHQFQIAFHDDILNLSILFSHLQPLRLLLVLT